MGPGPFCIENWKTIKKIKIFDDDWFPPPKKKDRGWVGGMSYIQLLLDVWNFFNFARPLNLLLEQIKTTTYCVDLVNSRGFNFCEGQIREFQNNNYYYRATKDNSKQF